MTTAQEASEADALVLKTYEREDFEAWTKPLTKAKLQDESNKYTAESVRELDDYVAWVRRYANLKNKAPPKKDAYRKVQDYHDAVGLSVLAVLSFANQNKAIKSFKAQNTASRNEALEEIILACAAAHDQHTLPTLQHTLDTQTAHLYNVQGSTATSGKYKEAEAALNALTQRIARRSDKSPVPLTAKRVRFAPTPLSGDDEKTAKEAEGASTKAKEEEQATAAAAAAAAAIANKTMQPERLNPNS